MQLVTLRYCSLQEDKTDTVRVTLYCGVFVLTLSGSQFWEAHYNWRYCVDLGNPPLVGIAATLVARGNDSLTINIVLREILTEFSPVVRKQ